MRESKRGGSYRPRSANPGEVFGLLTVVRLHERIPVIGRMWQCACQCGAPQLRSSAELNTYARAGRIDACPSCAAGLAHHRRRTRDEICRSAWLALWLARRTLYGLRATRVLCEGVQEELEREIAPLRDAWEEAVPSVAEPYARMFPRYAEQRMSTLYPMSTDNPETPPDLRWECVHCSAVVERCFGCVECLDTACVDCVRKERHTHPDPYAAELATVAEAIAEPDGGPYGKMKVLSRERIRQMQLAAEARMAHDPILQDFAPEGAYLPPLRSPELLDYITEVADRAERFIAWIRTRDVDSLVESLRFDVDAQEARAITRIVKFMRQFTIAPQHVVSLKLFHVFVAGAYGGAGADGHQPSLQRAQEAVLAACEATWNAFRRTLKLPPERLLTTEDIRQRWHHQQEQIEQEARRRRGRREQNGRTPLEYEEGRRAAQVQTAQSRWEAYLTSPCPCGSGLWFVNCHGKPDDDDSKSGSNMVM